MEIKGTGLPPIRLPSLDAADLRQPASVRSTVENWKTNQILKAIVTETSPQQARLNIQGVITETRTPANLKLEVGQQLTVQVTSKNAIPDLKLLSVDKPVEQVVAEQLRTTLPRQQPVTPLLSDFKAINTRPELQRLLPPEVLQEAKKFLAALPEAKQLAKPETIKQALQNSGVFLEHKLAQATTATAEPQTDRDLRAILLRLANLLRNNLPQATATSRQTTPSSEASPRLNHLLAQLPQPQPAVASRLPDVVNAELLKLELFKHIESSLARIQGLQLTSVKTDDTSNPLWAMEIPVRNQASLDLFDVRIQQEQQNDNQREAKHRWSFQLAFDLDGLGPVYVRVSWFNEKVSANFWVKQQQTHELFSDYLEILQGRLLKAGLDIDRLNLNHGEPQALPAQGKQPILDEKA
ncbi:MAG: flagellar hook-length control protein FliK [Thioalkalispiraceae bacterium]|jgi:hypothetical protein